MSSPSPLPPACSLVYKFVNSSSKGGSLQGCVFLLLSRGSDALGLPAGFLRDTGASLKHVLLKARAAA